MHWFSPFFYMEAKLKPVEKKDKKLTSFEMKFLRRTARYNLFDHKMNERILEELKVGPIDE